MGVQENPPSAQNPTADFLMLADTDTSNRELNLTLGAPGMPETAISSYEAHESGLATTASKAVLAIGQLLVASKNGRWLDPDQETWAHVIEDDEFRAARETFTKMNERDAAFAATRYTMTRRILAITCMRRLAYQQEEQAATRNVS